jgi:hypothetical protein
MNNPTIISQTPEKPNRVYKRRHLIPYGHPERREGSALGMEETVLRRKIL